MLGPRSRPRSEPNVCACDSEAYEGLFCQTPTRVALSRCSYNGECNADQTCTCSQGYSGVDCSLFNCSQVNNCSNAGTSGPITLAAYLYTALSDALTFRVQAYDQGTPRLAATAQVSITIVRAKLSSTCDDIVSSSVTRYVIAFLSQFFFMATKHNKNI